MSNRKQVLLAFLLWPLALVAQSADVQFTVGLNASVLPPADSANVAYFLDGKPLTDAHYLGGPSVSRDVVFVLDTATHQQSLAARSEQYVTEMARQMQGHPLSFSLVTTDPRPVVARQTSEPADLKRPLIVSPAIETSKKAVDRNLQEGIRLAVSSLKGSHGDRIIVVLSDGDDDIYGSALKELKTGLAREHIRLFSILIANHDFYGTKAHSAWGVNLNSLARFSGEGQWDTDWQDRPSDAGVLRSVAARASGGGQIQFSLPSAMKAKAGVHRLTVRVDGKGINSGPFILPEVPSSASTN